MLASGGAWRAVAAAAGERWTAPDLPGHGAAPNWIGGDYMADALAVAVRHAPAGPFDLVGHSYGGCLALRLLVDMPERVRSLALIEPVMFAAGDPATVAAHFDEMAPHADALRGGHREDAARIFTALWGDGRPWKALKSSQRVYIADRIHLITASEPGIASDAHGILTRLPADPPPVLLVTRRNPPPVVASIAHDLAARLPGTARTEIGRGHMIPMEAPEALADRLCAFWNEADPAL